MWTTFFAFVSALIAAHPVFFWASLTLVVFVLVYAYGLVEAHFHKS